jgi:hypothetical protein
MQVAYPTQPKDRFEVYRFFNGLAVEGKEGLDRRRSRVPLVKSFLLEHVSSASGRTPRPPQTILRSLGVDAAPLDETFMEVRDLDAGATPAGSGRRTVGYVEQFSERFFAYYTSDESQSATKRVNRWITRSADLDSSWFSSQLLQRLWDTDVSLRGNERFGKLTFRHESIFEMPEDAVEESDAEDTQCPVQASGLHRGCGLPCCTGTEARTDRSTVQIRMGRLPSERDPDRIHGDGEDLPGLRPGPKGLP